MKKYLLLFVCLFALSCSTVKSPGTVEIDLAKQFAVSEKKTDTKFIFFGTNEGRKSLLSGWSDNEKDQGGTYQWAIEPKAAFVFNADESRPLFLHLRIKSFFENPTGVYLNAKFIARIEIDKDTEFYTVPLPADTVRAQTNLVELQFSEVRPSPRSTDIRKLAAAAYYAAISPSKYILENLPQPLPELWSLSQLRVNNKNLPMTQFKTGGSLSTYQRLSPNAVVKFGYYYRPSLFSENDDFASFSVFLRKDGEPEKRIFHRRLADRTLLFESIPLSSFVPSPDVYRIQFKIERNSIFNDTQTAWLEPSVTVDAPPPVRITEDPRREALRQANQGANVVLIVLDAGGAKHFSTYGYPKETTPHADALAREGTRFDKAYCQAVYTLASTACLMSGQFPIHHRIIYNKNRLSSDTFTMAEAFRAGGYATGTFVSNGNASDIFGMAQGFEEVDDVFRYKDYTGWGQDITNAFEKWLNRTTQKKFFAYLHYREPHAPFNPPPEWKFKFVDPNYKGTIIESYELRKQINMGQVKVTQADKDFIMAQYDANLNYGDYQVGLVISKLKDLGIYDRTIIIVTADHGEAFWEHNFQGHNSQLYQESIHIPMVIKLARGSDVSRSNANTIRSIDIYPTLVDLLGFSRKNVRVDGRSFLPYFVSAPADDREVVSQVIMERQYALLDSEYKYMVDLSSRKQEMYNLRTDPLEQKNLVDNEPVRAGYYQTRLFAMLAAKKNIGAFFAKTEQAVIDEAARENLRALGYLDEE